MTSEGAERVVLQSHHWVPFAPFWKITFSTKIWEISLSSIYMASEEI